MRLNTIITLLIVSAFCLAGCSSNEKKQINRCVDDIKSGLNDPNSFEMVSARPFKVDNETYRVDVIFTAKNAFGGRVKSQETCGFKW